MWEKVVHILSSMIFPEKVLWRLTWPSLALQGLAVNPVSLACYVFYIVMPITKCVIYAYISNRLIMFS